MEFIKSIFLPSNILVLLICSAVLIYYKKNSSLYPTGIIFTSIILYLILSFGPISSLLLRQLEYQYSPLKTLSGTDNVDNLVVLAGYGKINSKKDLVSQINDATAVRLLEVSRIVTGKAIKKIVVSGNNDAPLLMSDILREIGLTEGEIIVDVDGNDTYQSAVNIRRILNKEPFILVTSAGHMYRSMQVFEKLGMTPIPAPTNYLTSMDVLEISFIPSPRYLIYSDLAIGEYMAIIWYYLTNKI